MLNESLREGNLPLLLLRSFERREEGISNSSTRRGGEGEVEREVAKEEEQGERRVRAGKRVGRGRERPGAVAP